MSNDELWSVEIVIGHDERAAFDYAGPRVVGPDNYIVVMPWEDGPSTVHIDVRAPTPEEAQACAVELYREMRESTGLAPDEQPGVLSVGHVVGVPHPWDRYIFAAEEMLDQQRYGLAVVAAQTHCEMYIRHALETVAERDGTPIAKLAPGLLRSCSLTDQAGPEIFEALLGVRPTAAPCWERYRNHVYRRNGVVHKGAEVTPDLAHESVRAVVDMVRFVESALGSA